MCDWFLLLYFGENGLANFLNFLNKIISFPKESSCFLWEKKWYLINLVSIFCRIWHSKTPHCVCTYCIYVLIIFISILKIPSFILRRTIFILNCKFLISYSALVQRICILSTILVLRIYYPISFVHVQYPYNFLQYCIQNFPVERGPLNVWGAVMFEGQMRYVRGPNAKCLWVAAFIFSHYLLVSLAVGDLYQYPLNEVPMNTT